MNIKYILIALAFVGFTALGVRDISTHNQKVQLKEVQVKDTTADLKELELKYDNLNVQLENTDKTKTDEIKKLQEEKAKLEEDRKRLEAELQAKLKRQADERTALQNASNRATGVATAHAASAPVRVSYGGNKQSWLEASGIPADQWWAVDSIVSRESGWDPCAYNPGQSDCNANPSSACGLAQSLPCGKQSVYGHWTDPVANLKWQYDYVRERYGGYPQAVAFWNANHWY